MGNLLTDRQFWVNYWESKKGLAVWIPRDYLFSRQLADVIKKYEIRSAIELGGFPGYYTVFLKKHFNLDVTLLDYFIHPPVTSALLEKNGLKNNSIHIIETDLFKYTPQQRYDLVLSCGLIEHFEDTADIIHRHIAFLHQGSVLFITLPNFRAVNGWFQKRFDKENYDKHNISSMDPGLLAEICKGSGLEILYSGFFGRFSIWLENEQDKSTGIRFLKKIAWAAGKTLTKLIPFESKSLSPYIMLIAKMPA